MSKEFDLGKIEYKLYLTNDIKSIVYKDKEYDIKVLEAFEIIKEKRVDVELLMKTESANDYNKYSKNVNQSHNLGQRQYDFLKEVLL